MPNPKAMPLALLQWWRETLALPSDSVRKTLFVTVLLSLVCSLLVTSAAVLLKPRQLENQALDRKRNILEVAGLLTTDKSIDELFADIETHIVELDTGEYAAGIDATTFDANKAAKEPAMSRAVAPERDLANIKRRADYAPVYLVKHDATIKTIILPVQGYGLWSTLYGFIALQADANTVVGLRFYQHAETPGLGGEIDNPRWLALWQGKMIYAADDGANQEPRISVLRGRVDPEHPAAPYQVDGIAGATLTSRGVMNLLRFWLSEQGFAPYLSRLRTLATKEAANQ